MRSRNAAARRHLVPRPGSSAKLHVCSSSHAPKLGFPRSKFREGSAGARDADPGEEDQPSTRSVIG